jgi:hypothetical protein
MARHKSTVFQGGTAFETDIDELTFRRTIRNAIGDTAFVYDKVTGEHAEAATCIHTGSGGRGALLGIPVVNQYINRTPLMTNPGVGKDGGTGVTWLAAMPYFIVDGETEVMIEVVAAGGFDDNDLVAYFRDAANFGTVVGDDRVPLTRAGAALPYFRANIKNLTAGKRLLFIEADTGAVFAGTPTSVIRSCRVWPGRSSTSTRSAYGRQESSPFNITTPAAAAGVAHVDFDAGRFSDLAAIDGHIMAHLNRNQNGLYEYMTGWPAGGPNEANAAYTHVDHDGAGVADDVNPARSRFLAHTRSLYASEPECEFNQYAESFGAFKPDGGFVVNLVEPPTLGMLDFYAPWPTVTASQTLRQLRMPFPDFQTASSRLKWMVLAGTDVAGSVGNWSARVTAGGATSTATFAMVTGSSVLAVAEAGALAFSADDEVLVTIATSRSGARASIDELCLLGAYLVFDP